MSQHRRGPTCVPIPRPYAKGTILCPHAMSQGNTAVPCPHDMSLHGHHAVSPHHVPTPHSHAKQPVHHVSTQRGLSRVPTPRPHMKRPTCRVPGAMSLRRCDPAVSPHRVPARGGGRVRAVSPRGALRDHPATPPAPPPPPGGPAPARPHARGARGPTWRSARGRGRGTRLPAGGGGGGAGPALPGRRAGGGGAGSGRGGRRGPGGERGPSDRPARPGPGLICPCAAEGVRLTPPGVPGRSESLGGCPGSAHLTWSRCLQGAQLTWSECPRGAQLGQVAYSQGAQPTLLSCLAQKQLQLNPPCCLAALAGSLWGAKLTTLCAHCSSGC